MNKVAKLIVAALISLFAVGSLTACAPAEKLDMSTYAAVIDVRTPEEYAEGHLDGAVLINFQGANFLGDVSVLDKSADYVIYCRSGNRAGQAIDLMKANGFTGNLVNAGGVDAAASSTGIEIVR